MNRLTRNRIAAASVVLAIAAPALTPAAHAGGSVALYLSPRDTQQAQLMDFGLRAYGLYNGLKGSGARIEQQGRDNNAGVVQKGRGNIGVISQRGDGHAATLQQQGNGNSYGIFQFGRGSRADILQPGGSTGAAITFGW